MDHGAEAQRLFLEGYNCAQSVYCAYCDRTGMDLAVSARLSSSFGAGLGRLREVCGAVSGAMLAFGVLCGYDDPADPTAKARHYARVQEFARRFTAAHGTILCRELLRDVPVTKGAVPEARTPEFYARRPCLRVIGSAAEILDAMLKEQDIRP